MRKRKLNTRSMVAAAPLGAGLLLFGCASTSGPELVTNSHIEYNRAVSQVLKQELLLNVVRRRYLEAPQFLSVSSINSNITTTTSAGAGVGVGDLGDGNIVDASADGSVAFSDSPTVTITPRQGETMANQLHGPLRVSIVSDLVGAGYPPSGAFNLLVEQINDLRGPDLRLDGFLPASEDWQEAMALVDRYYADGSLLVDRFKWNDPYNAYAFPAEQITPEMWITTISTGEKRWKSFDGGKSFFYTTNEMIPAMWLDLDDRAEPDGQRLMQLLNVQPDVQTKIWIFESARVASGPDLESQPEKRRPTLKLRMRSLYNVLNFFAYGVEVPVEDEQTGRATDLSTYREAVGRGLASDLGQLIRVRSSKERPADAYQAVFYRDTWFYIEDDDRLAKAGFNALYDLWQLSIKAPSEGGAPVTTIQVN